MSWQLQIVQQEAPKPPRILVYGQPGIGKTSLGASLPNTLMLDYDKGAAEVKDSSGRPVRRIKCLDKTWSESLALVRAIAKDPGEYKSLVIDTIDGLEAACISYICSSATKKSLGDFTKGDGYLALAAEWRVFLAELDVLYEKGIMVCLLAHSVIKQIEDPTVGQFDIWTSQLQKKPWAETVRWADIVGFAGFDVARLEKEKRAIVTGARFLAVTKGSGYEAKNRFNIRSKLELSWPALESAIHGHREPGLREKIEEMARGTEFAAKAQEYLATTPETELQGVYDALKERIDAVHTAKKNESVMKLRALARDTPYVAMVESYISEGESPAEVERVLREKLAADAVPERVTSPDPEPTRVPAPPAGPAAFLIASIRAISKGTEAEGQAENYLREVGLDVVGLREIESALQAKFGSAAVSIRGRIGAMSIGTDFQAKAAEFVKVAGEDIQALLEIESKLKEKLNGATVVP